MISRSLAGHRSIFPGGSPPKGVNKEYKDLFPIFSLTFRDLNLKCLAFVGGHGGFRELREAGRSHFHLSWYLLVPGITSYDRFSLNGPCQREGLHKLQIFSREKYIEIFHKSSNYLRLSQAI